MMKVKGKVVKLEIDTGSGAMPESTFIEKFKDEVELKTTSQILKTYNGSQIPLTGKPTVNVKGEGGQAKQLRLLVAQVPGPIFSGGQRLALKVLDRLDKQCLTQAMVIV